MRSDGMPHYFFHLYNDVDVPDFEGEHLADLEAARIYAIKQARALIGDGARKDGRIVLHHRIDIEDADHNVVTTVRFADVLNIQD